MFDLALRRLKDQFAEPICQLIGSRISPTTLTQHAFVCGLAACYVAAYSDEKYLALTFWIMNRVLSCFDGSLACAQGAVTEVGGFLDLLADFIIYSLIPISVGVGQERIHGEPDWKAIATLEASFHINNFVLYYLAAVASKKGSDELRNVLTMPALIETFEAGLLFTMMFIFPSWITTISWAMAITVLVGTAQRVISSLPFLGQLDTASIRGAILQMDRKE